MTTRDSGAAAGGRTRAQRGVTLIITLMMLMIVGIVSVGAVRAVIGDESTAGQSREKQRATNMAIAALTFAEQWLQAGQNATLIQNCTGAVDQSAAPRVCTNSIVDPASTAWADASGVALGNGFNPGNITVSATSPGSDTFYAYPRFHIQKENLTADKRGTLFRVYGLSYGASSGTVSVVSSTVQIITPARSVTQ